MSAKCKTFPQVETLGTRVLLSGLNPFHRKFVDVTGDVLRLDLSSPPQKGPGSAQVYNLQGEGGNATMGDVQTSGSLTRTTHGNAAIYRGNITLTNSQGSVRIAFNANTYRIKGGTGAFQGAMGIGSVVLGQNLDGLAFNADQ